jgi:hypothetical protein
MLFFLGTLACLVAYVGGLIIVTKITPQLFIRSYDEGLFMGIAAADVMGGILAFGAVAFIYGLLNGAVNLGARVLAFLLLAGIFIIAVRMLFRSFRTRNRAGTFLISCVIAGIYSLLLAAASIYSIVLLFSPTL